MICIKLPLVIIQLLETDVRYFSCQKLSAIFLYFIIAVIELNFIYIVSHQIKSISLMNPLSELIKQVFSHLIVQIIRHVSFSSQICDKTN